MAFLGIFRPQFIVELYIDNDGVVRGQSPPVRNYLEHKHKQHFDGPFSLFDYIFGMDEKKPVGVGRRGTYAPVDKVPDRFPSRP